jgi:hypothetical protein
VAVLTVAAEVGFDPQAIAQGIPYGNVMKWWNNWDCGLFYQVMIDRHGDHPIEDYITVLSQGLPCGISPVQVYLACI